MAGTERLRVKEKQDGTGKVWWEVELQVGDGEFQAASELSGMAIKQPRRFPTRAEAVDFGVRWRRNYRAMQVTTLSTEEIGDDEG